MIEKEINRSFGKNASIFLAPMIKEKKVTLKAVFYYLVMASYPIFHIFVIQKLVFFIEHKDKLSFMNLMIIYGILNIVYEIIYLLTKNWSWVVTIGNYRKIIHKEYLRRFVTLLNTESEKIGTGKWIAIIDKGIENWSTILDDLIKNSLNIVVAFLFSLYTVLKIDIFYGLVFLIIYLSIHFIGGYINTFTIIHRRERQEKGQTYLKQLVKIIMSKFEILQTSKIGYEISKLDNISDEMMNCNYKISKYNHLFFRVPEGFIVLAKYLILMYLGLKILDGKETFSTFVGVFGVFTVLDSAISKSMSFYKDFTHKFTAINRMWEYFDGIPKIYGYDTGSDFVYKNGNIKFKNVSFGYSKNKSVFKNLDLKISGGKITAFVGNSGGGKTTIVKIISQYIKQSSGNIFVDGQDLNSVSLKSYYKNIGYLTQEPSVFDGTVLENLTYSLDSRIPIDMKHIDEIINLSKCEFIYDLKNGINTEIGEKGIRLSGGQRQRLAIAKIMIKNPKIIILDEHTSALDSISEKLITKAMDNLFEGRTVLVIAHRLQTVKYAHEIIVINNGKIIERGNHKNLVEKKGVYNEMLELQSGF